MLAASLPLPGPSATTTGSESAIALTKTVSPPSATHGGANLLETARREFVAIGDAKSYLGKRAMEWANKTYKNGCNSWEQDEKTKEEAETLLRERYPESPWTAKLSQEDH